MNRIARGAFALLVLLVAASSRGSAQGHPFTAAVGIGQGSGWPTCADCTGIDHRQGLSGFVQAGVFATPRIVIAVEGNRWTNTASDANSQFQSMLIVGQLFAADHGGFWLKVGAGAGTSTITFAGGIGQISSTGLSYAAGLGYDVAVTPHLAVTPFADFLATTGAPEHASFAHVTGNLDGNVARFGVAISWK